MWRRTVGFLLGAAGVSGLVAGCGGGGGSGPFALVQTAYAKTLDAHTSRVAFTTNVNGPAGMNITQTGNGVVDFTAHRAELEFGGGPQGATPGQNLRVIMMGKDIWVSIPPALTSQLPGGKPFVHVDADGDDGSGDPIGRLSRPDDPAQTLADLKGLSQNGLQRVGSDKVRGANATHFKAQLDLNKVAAADPKVKPHIDLFEQMLGTNVLPVQVWVDGDDHVRRVQVTMNNLHVPMRPQQQQASSAQASPTPAPDGQGAQLGNLTLNLSFTEEFYDFGAKADITPPPPDQVMEAAQMRTLAQQRHRA